jgi:oligopeptide transport system permease protein
MTALAERMARLDEVKGRSLWADARVRFFRNKAAVAGLGLLVFCAAYAVFGQLIASHSFDYQNYDIMGDAAKSGPNWTDGYYFGADQSGRDLFARTAMGTRVSLIVGLIATAISVTLGTLYGAVSGYMGGRVDAVLMRTVDIIMSIPYLFVLILFLVMFGRSLSVLYLAIGLLSWPGMARIVRGQTLTLKGREYIEAAQATGVSPFRIIMMHIVPNLLGIVVVYSTLLVPDVIIGESFISFLGLGVQEPQTSLGTLISDGAKSIYYNTQWEIAFPIAFFMMVMFGFYFVGDGLRDALDPKDR